MRRFPGHPLVASVALALFACSAPPPPARKRPPPLVKVAKPEVRDVDVTLDYTAEVKPIDQIELQSKVTGYVQRVLVDKGDRVRKGQLLADVRPSDLPQQVTQAREQVGQAEAQYKLQAENTRRARELFKRGLIARAELDNADALLAVAKAARGASSAGLGVVSTRLRETDLFSPFDGWVTKRYLDPGALVQPGPAAMAILQLMMIDRVRVFVNVVEKDVPRIRKGLTATITVDSLPGRTFTGVVDRFSPALDAATRTLEAQVIIDNAEEKGADGHVDRPLKPGMYGHVALRVATHPKAVVLPIEAVVTEDTTRSVFVVDGVQAAPGGGPGAGPPRLVGKARRVAVKTGFDGGSWLEITEGLTGDEEVVVQGLDLISDGAPVSLMRATPPSSAAATPPADAGVRPATPATNKSGAL